MEERDCNKSVEWKSPEPTTYEPFKTFNRHSGINMQTGEQRPLSKRKNFMNLSSTDSFGRGQRFCAFNGDEKRYDTVYLSMVSKGHDGPAQLNVRDC